MTPAYQCYRKTTPTQARQLTTQEVELRGGVIHTLEGPRQVAAGDYVARDRKGEWPIRQERIMRDYRQLSEPDAEGWAWYQSLDMREAAQMATAFTVDGLSGKAGDYLVRGKDGQWPVDRELFEVSYTLVNADVL
jgi:hypothetical protein